MVGNGVSGRGIFPRSSGSCEARPPPESERAPPRTSAPSASARRTVSTLRAFLGPASRDGAERREGCMTDRSNGATARKASPHQSKIYSEFSHLYDKIFERVFFPRIQHVVTSLRI